MAIPQIDPNTGEVISQGSSGVQIDPATGEVIPPSPEQPSMMQRAGNFGRDVAKGLGESAVSLMSTGDEFARKHLPAVLTNGNMGFGPPANLENVEQMSKPANATQAVGAGLGDALTAMIPADRAVSVLGKVGKMAGEAAEPVLSKLSEFNQAWNPLPLKSRAVNMLGDVADAAKDVPVSMTETEPAVQGFRQYVSTGGRGTPVINKLTKRMAADEPMNFPEARQFYTNVSRASARPGFLRRAIESPTMPDLRRNLGGVREAMGNDLTNAAESVGMGDKYTQGLREYANAAKLNRGLKLGGAVATEEALRRSGILGKMVAPLMGQ